MARNVSEKELHRQFHQSLGKKQESSHSITETNDLEASKPGTHQSAMLHTNS
jgi:hypothetical protein